MEDEIYMQEALLLAKRAMAQGEVPIGCIIVQQEKIIGRGYNTRNTVKNPLGHAELIAIDEAARTIGDWRLIECTLYVTIEPCPMCAGAIVQARVPRVVYGAKNPKAGCVESICHLLEEPRFNHQAEIVAGVLEAEAAALMVTFFKQFRKSTNEAL